MVSPLFYHVSDLNLLWHAPIFSKVPVGRPQGLSSV